MTDSKTSRRKFVRLAGSSISIMTLGGVTYRAVDQGLFSTGKGPAYEPWQNWRNAGSTAERIVAAGILAANPHNSQPWLFRISTETIDLFADSSRNLGAIDPFLRELHIGLGCVLENMVLAATADGIAAEVQLMPEPTDKTHVAQIKFHPSNAVASELYDAIPKRHTDRSAYDTTRPVAENTLAAIKGLVNDSAVRLFWCADPASRVAFGNLAIAATEALVADEQQSQDSHTWWRQRWSDLQSDADGLTLDAQGLSPLVTIAAKLLPDGSRRQNDRIFVNNMREINIPTATAFGILAVRNGMDNLQRLACGRTWQRMHLWGTMQGLALQPLCQMCERVDREQQLGSEQVFGTAVAKLLGDTSWQAIMPFRIGYPTKLSMPSPRRAVSQVTHG